MSERIVTFVVPRGDGSTNLQVRCVDGEVSVSEEMAMKMVEEIFEGFPAVHQKFIAQVTGQ